MAIKSPELDSQDSFIQIALSLGGKSKEEARRTGAIDRADDHVEQLFKPQYQTVNSPAHRIVWDRDARIDPFLATADDPAPAVAKIMDDSFAVACAHRRNGTLLN